MVMTCGWFIGCKVTCRVLTIQWWCQPTEFVRLSVKSSVLFWGDDKFDIIWHWLSQYVNIHCYSGIPCACMYNDAVCINTVYIYTYYYYIIIYIYIFIYCVPSICIYTLYIHLQHLIIKIHSYIEIIEQSTCRTSVLNPNPAHHGGKVRGTMQSGIK
jgi:hypothetical protein